MFTAKDAREIYKNSITKYQITSEEIEEIDNKIKKAAEAGERKVQIKNDNANFLKNIKIYYQDKEFGVAINYSLGLLFIHW